MMPFHSTRLSPHAVLASPPLSPSLTSPSHRSIVNTPQVLYALEILDDDEIRNESDASQVDTSVVDADELVKKLSRSKQEVAADAAAEVAREMNKRMSGFKMASRASSSVFAAEGRLTRLSVPNERASLDEQISTLEQEARNPVRVPSRRPRQEAPPLCSHLLAS